MSPDYVYEELNKAWKSTCKVILGEEIGNLSEYEKWLKSGMDPILKRKSSLSKKDVVFPDAPYCEGAKFLSFDEVNFEKKYDPIDINKIKDLDSIINEVQDRIYYTGNVVLGNSKYIEKSTNMTDCFYAYETIRFGDSKYIAYNTMGRLCDNMFGTNDMGESSFCIRCFETYKGIRNFEGYWNLVCNDCYYSQGLENCQDCMFCFNLKSKKYCIGNLELEKSKYLELKKKLLEEIRETLTKNKKIISLAEMAERSGNIPAGLLEKTKNSRKKQVQDKNAIESFFSATSNIVLSRPLHKIDDYSTWLLEKNRKLMKYTSSISNESVFVTENGNSKALPKNRLISEEEADALESHLKLGEKEVMGLSVENAHNSIGKIAFFVPDITLGNSRNMIECGIYGGSTNCYKVAISAFSKNCACTFWPRTSENILGSTQVFDCKFCMKCYYSTNLTRCFECDSCENCTDLYFSHNCENVHDSMFCFNVKNKRNAIGNVEYPKEQYLKIKKFILNQVADEIEKTKSLRLSIYNLGCFKKK